MITILLALLLTSCRAGEDGSKIFFVDSYHVGYPSSDGVTEGIRETLSGKDLELEVFYMDSKQHPDEDWIRNSLKYVTWRSRRDFMFDLKEVYKASTKEVAELKIDLLEDRIFDDDTLN